MSKQEPWKDDPVFKEEKKVEQTTEERQKETRPDFTDLSDPVTMMTLGLL